jgi:hypothetical protein
MGFGGAPGMGEIWQFDLSCANNFILTVKLIKSNHKQQRKAFQAFSLPTTVIRRQ